MSDWTDIVIGAGSAGLSYAKSAAARGARVLLIERDALGGTCVNRGCVPKKLMWDAAWHQEQAGAFREGERFGVDFEDLRSGITSKIEDIHASFKADLDACGVDLRRGSASVDSNGMVRLDNEDLRAERLILATGARPMVLDVPGAELCSTSDDVFRWRKNPDRIVILGGGYIGCEFAAVFRGFGAQIDLADPNPRILEQFAPPLAEAAQNILRDRGVALHFNAKAHSIERKGDGVSVHLDSGTCIQADAVIAAIGRTPNIDELGPIAAKLNRAKSGALKINSQFETSIPGIYAIGDIADRLPLTPVATRDGDTLARMLHSNEDATAIDLSYVASAAFVMPPIAQVGKLEGIESKSGGDLAAGALAAENHWSLRTTQCLSHGEQGLNGVGLMSKHAAEMISPFAALLAIADGGNPEDATGVHPTFGEELIGR